MIPTLILYLFLQKLQYCTADGNGCTDWVKRLSAGENEASREADERWPECGPVFLKDASPVGISALLSESWIWAPTTASDVAQDLVDTSELGGKITIDQLEMLNSYSVEISSKFLANLQDIRMLSKYPDITAYLPANILEYYDGPMDNISWATPEQFELFGSKLEKEILCMELKSQFISDNLFASISPRCLRGFLRGKSPLFAKWSAIHPDVIAAWSNHLEEDLKYVKSNDYLYLPTSVWQKIFKSAKLLEHFPKKFPDLLKSNIPHVSLSEIGHVQFAEIARQNPVVAKILLETNKSKLPEDLFASCGKIEMKVLEPLFGTGAFWETPKVIENISSAVSDSQHYCSNMDIEVYSSTLWLRRYGSKKCHSLISALVGDDAEKLPELSEDGSIWELYMAWINNGKSTSVENTIQLVKSQVEFCELMAEATSSKELERLDDRVLAAIGGKCALALKPLITKDVAPKLGPFAFRMFTADDFKLKLSDISSEQVPHLSDGVPKELSAFTKVTTEDLLSCDDHSFGTFTDSQIGEIQAASKYSDWIAFRRQASQLLYQALPGSISTPFMMCRDFQDKVQLGFEDTECLAVLSRVIRHIPDSTMLILGALGNYAKFQPLWYGVPSKVMLRTIAKTSFKRHSSFILPHDGQKYDIAQSLDIIRKSPESLANPASAVRHRTAHGVGPLRAWLGELLDTMKDGMISDMSQVDSSIQKFKFPIKGNDGVSAGFLVGKTLQQGLKLPFALDPEFYKLVLNAENVEIETYFKDTYAQELEAFRSIYLFQYLEGDFELAPEQEEQVKQIEQDQSMTPEERARAIKRIRNVARFNYNKEEGDFVWAPLSELTFNGFMSKSNYNSYEIPRGSLGFEEWNAQSKAVYSEFDYDSTGEYYVQFYGKCLGEFKEFVQTFRSGLGYFLRMPSVFVENTQPFSEMLVSKINALPMAAEHLISKINVEVGADIDSWYGPVNRQTFFEAFLECLTPKQLSKLVAVWTGAASTNLDSTAPKVTFYDPLATHRKYSSRTAIELSTAKSSSVVVHSGDEYESFLRQFSRKLHSVMGATGDIVDPLSNGEESVEFYPSEKSFSCFSLLQLPKQDARKTIEALIEFLNDDPSNLYDPRV